MRRHVLGLLVVLGATLISCTAYADTVPASPNLYVPSTVSVVGPLVNASSTRRVTIYRAAFFLGADTPFRVGAEESLTLPLARVELYASMLLVDHPDIVIESCPYIPRGDGTFESPEMKWARRLLQRLVVAAAGVE